MYIVKNITSGAFSFDLENGGTFTLSPGKCVDVSSFCSNEWILGCSGFRSLLDCTCPPLLLIEKDIVDASPYYPSTEQDEPNNTGGTVEYEGILCTGDIKKSDRGIVSSIITGTTESFTLHVRMDGDNNNDGLTESTAIATIQEAINRVPTHNSGHAIIIDIGIGNFEGFLLQDKFCADYKKFVIRGTLGAPDLTSGSTDGTSTGGTNLQLIDATQNWAQNELRGRLVKIGNEYKVAYQNSATTIDFAAHFSSTTNNKNYEILEQKTVINSTPSHPSWAGWAMIQVYNVTNVSIEKLKIDGLGNSYDGLDSQRSLALVLVEHCWIKDPYYGIWSTETLDLTLFDSYIENAYDYGFHAVLSMYANSTGSCIYGSGKDGVLISYTQNGSVSGALINNGRNGFYSWGCAMLDFDPPFIAIDNSKNGVHIDFSKGDMDSATISNNGEHGIKLGHLGNGNRSGHVYLNATGNMTLSDNGKSGIYVTNGSTILVKTALGTNNSGYGIELSSGSTAIIDSTTEITGTDGDIKLGANNILNCETDLSSDEDCVADLNNGCRVERRD